MNYRATAKAIATRSEDAYSSDRYSNWTAVAEKLLRAGYTEKQTEAIMRSKWTRWAADASAARYQYGNFPAKVAVEYAKKQSEMAVRKLTLETLGVEE